MNMNNMSFFLLKAFFLNLFFHFFMIHWHPSHWHSVPGWSSVGPYNFGCLADTLMQEHASLYGGTSHLNSNTLARCGAVVSTVAFWGQLLDGEGLSVWFHVLLSVWDSFGRSVSPIIINNMCSLISCEWINQIHEDLDPVPGCHTAAAHCFSEEDWSNAESECASCICDQ